MSLRLILVNLFVFKLNLSILLVRNLQYLSKSETIGLESLLKRCHIDLLHAYWRIEWSLRINIIIMVGQSDLLVYLKKVSYCVSLMGSFSIFITTSIGISTVFGLGFCSILFLFGLLVFLSILFTNILGLNFFTMGLLSRRFLFMRGCYCVCLFSFLNLVLLFDWLASLTSVKSNSKLNIIH
jgi:hypothetical protein